MHSPVIYNYINYADTMRRNVGLILLRIGYIAYANLSVDMSQVNSVLHPSGVAESSASFGWGKGEKVTGAGWQVTLCDPYRACDFP